MMEFEICRRIQNHALVYKQAGLDIPACRITYSEHADLVKELKCMIGDTENAVNTRYDFIVNCYGVDIEVVTLVK